MKDRVANNRRAAMAVLLAASPRTLLNDIKAWNDGDLRHFDGISPDRAMLLARRRVINALIHKLHLTPLRRR